MDAAGRHGAGSPWSGRCSSSSSSSAVRFEEFVHPLLVETPIGLLGQAPPLAQRIPALPTRSARRSGVAGTRRRDPYFTMQGVDHDELCTIEKNQPRYRRHRRRSSVLSECKTCACGSMWRLRSASACSAVAISVRPADASTVLAAALAAAGAERRFDNVQIAALEPPTTTWWRRVSEHGPDQRRPLARQRIIARAPGHVPHRQCRRRKSIRAQRHGSACRRIFCRVIQEIKDYLFDPPLVGFHPADVGIAVERDLKLFGAHPFLDQIKHA